MSRNGAGIYTLPAGSVITNGDTSDAADLNVPLADLEADMNTPRPVVAGGTGASSASAARTNLGLAIGTDVQAYDADLAAVAGLSSNGIVTRTGAGTAAVRTITAGGGVTVADGDGVSGNPTISATIATGTSVSASGTSVDFTGIPSWAKRITVLFDGISTNGTALVIVQLGDAGGFETSGYAGGATTFGASSNTTAGWGGSGAQLSDTGNASYVISGAMVIQNRSANSWIFSGNFAFTSGTAVFSTAGGKTLSDVLTQVRITTVGGTNTFDAGSINISWE